MGLGEPNSGAARAHGPARWSRERRRRRSLPGSEPTIYTWLAFCQAKAEATVKNPQYRPSGGQAPRMPCRQGVKAGRLPVRPARNFGNAFR